MCDHCVLKWHIKLKTKPNHDKKLFIFIVISDVTKISDAQLTFPNQS